VTLYTTAGLPLRCGRGAGGPWQEPSVSQRQRVRLDRCLPSLIRRRGPAPSLKVEQHRPLPARSSSSRSAAVASAAPTEPAAGDSRPAAERSHAAAHADDGPAAAATRAGRHRRPRAADLADDIILDRLLPCELDEAAAALEAMRRRLDVRRRLPLIMRTLLPLALALAVAHGWSAERIRRIGDLLLSGGLCRRVYGNGDGDSDGLAVENADALYPGALNADAAADWRCRPPDSLSTIGEQLRCLMLEIQGLCISQDGRSVDYGKLAESEQFAAYRLLARRLQRVNPEAGSPDERLAFFINVYNALVLHAKLARGGRQPACGAATDSSPAPPTSSAARATRCWTSSTAQSARSRPPPGAVWPVRPAPSGGAAARPAGAADSLHFALNCGARGCPPIRAYRAAGLRDQLLMAGRAYLSGDDAVRVSEDGRSLALSALFRWYSADFADSAGGSIAAWALGAVANHAQAGLVGFEQVLQAEHRAPRVRVCMCTNSGWWGEKFSKRSPWLADKPAESADFDSTGLSVVTSAAAEATERRAPPARRRHRHHSRRLGIFRRAGSSASRVDIVGAEDRALNWRRCQLANEVTSLSASSWSPAASRRCRCSDDVVADDCRAPDWPRYLRCHPVQDQQQHPCAALWECSGGGYSFALAWRTSQSVLLITVLCRRLRFHDGQFAKAVATLQFYNCLSGLGCGIQDPPPSLGVG
uniref:DUF547 domain-containing protein n=1 Tax=Macrostomum lignano TaxID=282301 RepID=A0A1I8FR84_9PLAT